MGATYSQFFPPAPSLTETNLPSQRCKVFVITGGTSGVGLELAKILYRAGGHVIITGRSEASLSETLTHINYSIDDPTDERLGKLDAVTLDLADLSTVKHTVKALRLKTQKINVLFLNAGVSLPPPGSKTKQGHELTLGVNCLGHLLLAHLLLPSMIRASQAEDAMPASTRIIWTSSIGVDLQSPPNGFPLTTTTNPSDDQYANYANSKLGNWYLAHYFSTLPACQNHSILNLTINPGNLKTNLMRNKMALYWASWPLLWPAKMGAYTALWAGLSGDLDMRDSGAYIVPWGRKHPAPREDLVKNMKGDDGGPGTGKAREFAEWCEEQVSQERLRAHR